MNTSIDWRKWLAIATGAVIGIGIAMAMIWVGKRMIADIQDWRPKSAIPSDAETLCKPFGGVREVGSRTYTIRDKSEETGLAVYCNDGSYIARYTNGKP